VLVTTGYMDELPQGGRSGGLTILAKPYRQDDLLERVNKALAPLTNAGIEVDVLQLQPIALANMVMFDQLPDPKSIDPDDPPPSIVLISIGVALIYFTHSAAH